MTSVPRRDPAVRFPGRCRNSMSLLLLAALPMFGETFPAGGPATTNNDASCDIGVFPAATLLLPYFEVDVESAPGAGETTIFTLTNTSNLPQIAHVVLWTDWAYPVLDFNIYLTGYDVQSINLYDVIARGRLAPDAGTGWKVSPVGELSVGESPLIDESSCFTAAPVQLAQPFITRMLRAFTDGRFPALGTRPGCEFIGDRHDNAVGYATIDVVGACEMATPLDADYFSSLIRFDNVLMGDYQQVNGGLEFAQGNPMVHIRALPEGGTPQSRAANPSRYQVNVSRTFYSRYQPAATSTADARQPLPSVFAMRWITGGSTQFQTLLKIWREGVTGADPTCSPTPVSVYPRNSALLIAEVVRFDEEENVFAEHDHCGCVPPLFDPFILPATSLTEIADTRVFPPNVSQDVAGWLYLNLDHDADDSHANQAWVTMSMRAEGRYSVDFDAVALGNGCTPPIGESEAYAGAVTIGPPPNANP